MYVSAERAHIVVARSLWEWWSLPYAIGPAPIGQPPDSESVIADIDGD